MTPKALISQAPKFYKTPNVFLYETRKVFDRYGYQYIIKGNKSPLNCAVHFTEKFNSEAFGKFGATSILLSTMDKIAIGSVVEIEGQLFAISEQKSRNNVLDEYDFVCLSVFDYYKDFIIDTDAQANRILGANSTRFLLAMPFDGIPIIPSMFAPKAEKYLSLHIFSTKTRSTPYKNENLLLEQQKKDFAEIYAVGLDTNELQKIAYDLMFNPTGFALANFPSWEQVNRYDLAFDLKPNINRASLEINYTLTNTLPQDADKLIKKIAWNFKFN